MASGSDAAFDVIVVGGGTGNNVAKAAAEAGLETALVEPGPLGGTCLNRGCNPSEMLIQRANVVGAVRDAERFGVDARPSTSPASSTRWTTSSRTSPGTWSAGTGSWST